MSSDESNQHRSDESHSDDPLKEKKVCFICGSHTIFIINIHEPRSGPNMIDVISEKFKMRPLNDDKFLCYSCNNWLINWYSMQNKYDRHNETDSSSAASTAREIATASGGDGRSGGNTSSSSGNSSDRRSAETAAGIRRRNACTDTNRRKCIKIANANDGTEETAIVAKNYLSQDMLNDTHDTVSEEEMASTAAIDENDGILFTAAIQAVRTKLQKYLYCTNKRKSDEVNDDDRHMPLSAFNHRRTRIDDCERAAKMVCRRRDIAPDAENRPNELTKPRRRYKCCELCRRPILRTNNHHRRPNNGHTRSSHTIRMCQKCNLSMHMHICNRSACLRPHRRHTKCPRKSHRKECSAGTSISIEDNEILNESNIVNKLKLLGTTIYYETEECFDRKEHRIIDALSDDGDDLRSVYTTPSANEIDTDIELKPTTIVEHVTNTQLPSANERSTNDSNEIVLTFNTVVTEVFPMQLFSAAIDYAGTGPTKTASSSSDPANSFHEIIKNVPKSLTITLA